MTIRHRATVLPGGTVKIQDSQLPDGAEVEVLISVEEHEEKLSPGEFVPDPNVPPFWERAQALGARVPTEVWEKVPKDLSKNLDHYLYGAPKEEEE